MKPLVYVAGPYTKPDPVANTRRAVNVGRILYRSGLVVPYVPHLSLLADLVAPMAYEEWLALDFDVIAHCHAVLRLRGESSGADREVELAGRRQIPVFTDRRDLYAWAKEWPS